MADEIVKAARERFNDCVEAESENRANMLDDVRFVYQAESYQWPESVRQERERQKRPCLTVNRLPSFIRQVVNDARQNRPAIKVSGVDSKADPQTAEILTGIVRHIERNSNADIAYDTAVEWAVSGGQGYFTIGTEYASDDSFEQEITIDRVVYPFSIYGDCDSEAGDSSDWKYAFQIVTMSRAEAERKYKTKEICSWAEGTTGDKLFDDSDNDELRLARYWKVEQQEHNLVLLSNGAPIREDELTEDVLAQMAAVGIAPIEGRSRKVTSSKVSLHILSGDAELEEPAAWAGRYIPIIPVYGAEFWIDGERVLKSLIRDAKDPQRMLNYWRTASTELVALAPKAPWIGPKGFTKSNPVKWRTANTDNHAYLEYDGEVPPQRQPFAGMPAGALQEAMNASDDIKSVTGMYDASLGARSNETSGKAILARQREGDISTYHFIDNLTRAIRHAGRVIVDLIPKVYDTPRIVRILGVDGTPQQVAVNQPTQVQDEDTGAVIERIYDLRLGRYDVDVKAGPSYTTARQESAEQMTALIQAFPQAAPILGDLLVKYLDWPDADEVSKRLQKFTQGGGADPAQAMQQVQQAQEQVAQQAEQVEAGKQEIEVGKRELEKMLADLKVAQANLKVQEANLKAQVAEAQAQLQQREQAVEVKNAMTDVRGQQMEQTALNNGAQAAQQMVQEALSAVAQQIKGLESALGKGQQQPIVVPITQGGTRRRVMVTRGPKGELMGDIEDVMDDDGQRPT